MIKLVTRKRDVSEALHRSAMRTRGTLLAVSPKRPLTVRRLDQYKYLLQVRVLVRVKNVPVVLRNSQTEAGSRIPSHLTTLNPEIASHAPCALSVCTGFP